MAMQDYFHRIARKTSEAVGSPLAFSIALGVILAWCITGPFFGYSDTWQLAINTGTTIVTFLMVFLIQNTQNRDSKAVHLKLDELIRANTGARNSLIELETLSDEVLHKLEQEFSVLRHKDDDLDIALGSAHAAVKEQRTRRGRRR